MAWYQSTYKIDTTRETAKRPQVFARVYGPATHIQRVISVRGSTVLNSPKKSRLRIQTRYLPPSNDAPSGLNKTGLRWQSGGEPSFSSADLDGTRPLTTFASKSRRDWKRLHQGGLFSLCLSAVLRASAFAKRLVEQIRPIGKHLRLIGGVERGGAPYRPTSPAPSTPGLPPKKIFFL